MRVGGRDVEAGAVDRDAPFDARRDAGRQTARVLPEQVAGGGIERLHLVAVAVNEQDAVVDDRRRLIRLRWAATRSTPTRSSSNVTFVDLLQRAESRRVVGPPPRQPLAVGRLRQHGFGDRPYRIERIGSRRRRAESPLRRESTAAERRPTRRGHRCHDCRIGGQLARTWLDSVFLEQKGNHLGVTHVA